jgi:hypothetical protein
LKLANLNSCANFLLLSEAPAEDSRTAGCKCTIEAIGIERLMFAVGWPFQSNTEGRDFIDRAPRSDAAKARGQGTHIRGQCAPASATLDDLPERIFLLRRSIGSMRWRGLCGFNPEVVFLHSIVVAGLSTAPMRLIFIVILHQVRM